MKLLGLELTDVKIMVMRFLVRRLSFFQALGLEAYTLTFFDADDDLGCKSMCNRTSITLLFEDLILLRPHLKSYHV